MNHYTVCCGYASHYHNTVTVEADSLDEALEKAIEQAGDDPHWKSADYCGSTFVDAIAEGEEADPWGDTAIPVPDHFTEKGEPPVVTLTGLRPPGGIDVTGGTVRIRFIEDAGTVTTEVTDPPAPPDNKPLVTVRPQNRWRSGCDRQRRPCTRAHSGSRRHRTARRTVDRRRHSSIANRLPCATPGRDRFPARRGRPGRGCIPKTDIREDHSMKLLTEEQRTKLLANGTRRGADHKPVVKWFNAGGTGTWLLSELDPEYPDECGFGLADLGFGTPESGSIGLLELTEYRGPFGLSIERDIHFTAAFPLSIYAEAARAAGRIVESGPELEAAARVHAGNVRGRRRFGKAGEPAASGREP